MSNICFVPTGMLDGVLAPVVPSNKLVDLDLLDQVTIDNYVAYKVQQAGSSIPTCHEFN